MSSSQLSISASKTMRSGGSSLVSTPQPSISMGTDGGLEERPRRAAAEELSETLIQGRQGKSWETRWTRARIMAAASSREGSQSGAHVVWWCCSGRIWAAAAARSEALVMDSPVQDGDETKEQTEHGAHRAWRHGR